MPFVEQTETGTFVIDVDWYLFLYSIWNRTLATPAQGGLPIGTVTNSVGPLDAGLVVVGNSGADEKVLPAGANGNVLTQVAGVAAWAAPAPLANPQRTLTAQFTSTNSNTETAVLNLPIGALAAGESFRMDAAGTFDSLSGGPSSARLNLRIGTAGTSADTIVCQYDSLGMLPASSSNVPFWITALVTAVDATHVTASISVGSNLGITGTAYQLVQTAYNTAITANSSNKLTFLASEASGSVGASTLKINHATISRVL